MLGGGGGGCSCLVGWMAADAEGGMEHQPFVSASRGRGSTPDSRQRDPGLRAGVHVRSCQANHRCAFARLPSPFVPICCSCCKLQRWPPPAEPHPPPTCTL